MRILTCIASAMVTLGLIFLLNNSWLLGGNRLPPLGKFLDPYHGFWRNLEPKGKKGTRQMSIAGLKDNVTVVYDSILIPHVFAKNDGDLYRTQGYVTASHRLWQMEFQTHAAAGRITEITGPGKDNAIINFDRYQRRLGMIYGATHAHALMMADPTTKMMLDNYTEGINAYIKSLTYTQLPLEYKLLDYKPERWTTLKCALLLMNMAQTLNMADKDIEMTNALKLFGKEVLDVLYPDREPTIDPIVDNAGHWKFNPVKINSNIPPALPDELIHIKKNAGSDPTTGSNNWAVSGSKTTTGAPMLCSDPHLNLSLPSLWYAIQLNAPGVNVMGASLPGAPTVVIGFNDSIAWGVTNAQRDLVDWYSIQYQNNKREKYLVDGKWINTKKVIEKYKVRGTPVVYDTVIYTQWGPVVYDRNYHAANNLKDYAFRWISHDGSNEFTAFYKLNRAKNHAEYMRALNHYTAPAQNFVFASLSGDIAMRIQGKYPVRRKDEGRFVLDGGKQSNRWKAFIPNKQNIMYKNPVRGFVSSANQYPADSTYPYYITANHWEAYRNRRINTVLRESNHIAVNDMMKLQNDNFNLKGSESLPYFLSMLDTAALNTAQLYAYNVLKGWDYYNGKESEGASYYEAWWDNLMPLIWDEMQPEKVDLAIPTTYNTIKLLKEQPDFSFFDIQNTPEKETAHDLLVKSFALGVNDIEQWKQTHESLVANHVSVAWADYKDSYIGHLLRIEPLNVHIRHGGNHDIVNANSKTHGPSWRMVVSLEKTGIKCWATYPGGQSGNAGSAHYTDMLTRWVNGQYFSLLFMHSPKEASSKQFFTTKITPAK